MITKTFCSSLTVALCAVALASTLHAQQRTNPPRVPPKPTGFTYDLVQKIESTNPMAGAGASGGSVAMRAKVQVDAAGHARMDVQEAAKSPLWNSGDYVLIGGSSMIIVSPATKEYFDLGTDFGAGALDEVMKGTGMNMKMTEGKFAFDTLPESDTIAGRKTTHYRITRDGAMEMSMGGGAMSVAVTSETDYFVARDRVPPATGLSSQSGMSIGPESMMSPELAEKMRSSVASMKGFALRTVAHSTSNIMGMAMETMQTTEVENLMEANVPPITITPPAGYTKKAIVPQQDRSRRAPRAMTSP